MANAPRMATENQRAEPLGAAAPPLMVEAVDVVKVYRSQGIETPALRGVSLQVPQGDMVAIMGPSGCGKTTLRNCLSGLDGVTSGIARIEGTDLATLSDNQKTTFRAKRMGFIFQFYNLLPVLSAVENVELPLVVSGVAAKQARQQAMAALEQVNLTNWANHRPAQLSGGQRQRVTIARALVNSPAIVWADEPTGDLDSGMANEIMNLMESLNRDAGQTFVIVTHDASIGRRCHRIVHMKDGHIEGEERLR
jgi:putative ABC transport system ATP-binding protein